MKRARRAFYACPIRTRVGRAIFMHKNTKRLRKSREGATTMPDVEQNCTAAEPQAERTFTQSEMNAIIQDRLARERNKYADYDALKAKAQQFDAAEEAGKTELQKATERAEKLKQQVDALTKANSLRDMRAKVAKDTGVPESLLSGETEEACTAQAKAILDFAKPNGYPVVRDGGEPIRKPTGSTREQFADWFEKVTK